MGERIQLMVNGTQREAIIEGEPSLLTVLRDTFDLTGQRLAAARATAGHARCCSIRSRFVRVLPRSSRGWEGDSDH